MYQNKVTLIGFLGNDAEIRTNDNRSFNIISLATKSSYKKDGQYISHTEWHRCVIFGKLAEFAGTLKKGAHLQVEGELRSREYETKKVGKKPAQKKTIWEIRVNSILKLDRAEKASPEDQEADSPLALEAAAKAASLSSTRRLGRCRASSSVRFAMNMKTAVDFLTRCFKPGETIALLLRRADPPLTTQRIVRLEQAMAPRYMAWLAYENHHGSNVYVAANPLLFASRKRTKESIAEVRHLYLDIDVDGDERIGKVTNSKDVPVPSVILATSPGKYQVLWRVKGFDFAQQESMLKLLAITFGGDSACTDRNRVLRMPGLNNCKYDPVYAVTALYPSGSTYSPLEFRLDALTVSTASVGHDIDRDHRVSKNTHSEQDWAWIVARLSTELMLRS